MATLVENAVRIKQTFDDIFDAIVEKGVSPSGGVDTYANAINAIDLATHIKPSEITDFLMVCGAEGYGPYTSTVWRIAPLANYYPIDTTYFVRNGSYNFVCQKDGVYQGVITGGSYGTTSGSTFVEPAVAIFCNNDESTRYSMAYIERPTIAAITNIGTYVLKAGDVINLYESGGNNGSGLYLTYSFRMFYIGNA